MSCKKLTTMLSTKVSFFYLLSKIWWQFESWVSAHTVFVFFLTGFVCRREICVSVGREGGRHGVLLSLVHAVYFIALFLLYVIMFLFFFKSVPLNFTIRLLRGKLKIYVCFVISNCADNYGS